MVGKGQKYLLVEAANAAPSTAEIRECLVVNLQRTNLILAPNIVSLISTVVSFTGSNGTCTIPRTTNPRTTIPNATIPRMTNPRTDQS